MAMMSMAGMAGGGGGGGGYTDIVNAIGGIIGLLGGTGDTHVHGSSSTDTTSHGTTHQTGVQENMSPEDMDLLRNIAAMFQSQATQYSRSRAISDSAGLQAQSLRGLREGLLPQIAGAEAQSGAYNSTSRQQLSNDAINRASDSLTQLRLNAIMGYGGLANNALQGAGAVLAALKGARITTDETTTTDNTSHVDTASRTTQEGTSGIFGNWF